MRVAHAFGQLPEHVAARPFARTAWAFQQLLVLERFDALTRDGEGLQAASRTALAFHEPRRLESERRDLLRRLQRGGRTVPVAEARERALRLVRSGAMNDLQASETAP